MGGFFDNLSRPLPRFYDLDVARRAQLIYDERAAIAARRMRMKPREVFCEVARMSYTNDSVGLLDVIPGRKHNEVYRTILLGDTL